MTTALRRNRPKLLLLAVCFALVLYALFHTAPVFAGFQQPADIYAVGQTSLIPVPRVSTEPGDILAAAYLCDALSIREAPDGSSEDEYCGLYTPASALVCEPRTPAGFGILPHAASPHGCHISILALSLGGNAPPSVMRRGT